ncbi:MAG: CRISPR-associated ring nuclease [Thermoproteota archaeon]
MKLGILATMGTSPPVVTEFVHYVERTEKIANLIIMTTSERIVRESAILASVATKDKFPHIHVKVVELPIADITSEEENYLFMEKAAQTLAELRRSSDKLYICLAGGRKEMVASMTLLAQFFDVDAMYHVVSTEVKAINVALEKIRKEIQELASSQDPKEYYRQKKEDFEPIMYPPSTSYNVIMVPIIPYPPENIKILKYLLSNTSIERKKLGLREEFLHRLKNRGLIGLTADRIIVTDEGRKFYDAVLKYLE